MIGSSVFAGLIGVPKALRSTHAMRHKMYSIHLLPCLQTQVQYNGTHKSHAIRLENRYCALPATR